MGVTVLVYLVTDTYFAFPKLTKQGKPKYPRGSLRGEPRDFVKNLGHQLLVNSWRSEALRVKVGRCSAAWLAKIIAANAPRNTNGTITPHYSAADVPGDMHAVQPHVTPADATHAVLQLFALMAH